MGDWGLGIGDWESEGRAAAGVKPAPPLSVPPIPNPHVFRPMVSFGVRRGAA